MDRDEAIKIVQNDGLKLHTVSEYLQNDKGIVLHAVRKNGGALVQKYNLLLTKISLVNLGSVTNSVSSK
jgi:hypothetical protein